MDEIAELNRLWDSMESRLSALSGDQEREYEIIDNRINRKILGKITIPVKLDEDKIIEKLQEDLPELFNPEKEYYVSGDGQDGTIIIEEFNPDGPNTKIAEMTTYEDLEDFDEFLENVLDISREQYLSGRDGWITKEYTIVTGTGGPHVEFTTGYMIRVYWAGKSREFTTYDDGARATMDRIEEYLNECYGGE